LVNRVYQNIYYFNLKIKSGVYHGLVKIKRGGIILDWIWLGEKLEENSSPGIKNGSWPLK